MYYYRARYYSPELQRFISEDPIRFGGGINFYAYASDNPVRYTDPMGLAIWICNRPAQGSIGWIGGNHAYLYDDRPGGGPCGMRGSSGSGGNSSPDDKGPFNGGNCTKVPGSDGTEDGIMKCCRETANNGPWIPGAHDCHNAADRCITGSGLQNPGAPGGRVGKCDPCSHGASGSW